MTTEEAIARGLIRVLGHYNPRANPQTDLLADTDNSALYFDEVKIKAHLARYVEEGCWGFEVRGPNWPFNDGTSLDWHRDCGGGPQKIIVWSNIPTEAREAARPWEEIALKPFDVVEIDNKLCEHKMPQKTGEPRWFARIVNPNKPFQPSPRVNRPSEWEIEK